MLASLRELDGRFRASRNLAEGPDPRLVAADVRQLVASLFELGGRLPGDDVSEPERRLAAATLLDPASRLRGDATVPRATLDQVTAVLARAASICRQGWLRHRPAAPAPVAHANHADRAKAIVAGLGQVVSSLARMDPVALQASAAPAGEELLELLAKLYSTVADAGGLAATRAARACLRPDLQAEHDLLPLIAELLEAAAAAGGGPGAERPNQIGPVTIGAAAERRAADREARSGNLNRPLLRRLLIHQMSSGKPAWPAELARRLGLRREQVVAEIHILAAAGLVDTAGLESADTGGAVLLNRKGVARYMFGDDLRTRHPGAMPVSLTEYRDMVAFAAGRGPTLDELKRRLEGVELPNGAVEQLQIALASRRPLLLYGPPGNGKTMLARLLVTVLRPTLMVPVATESEGLVIRIYNQAIHRLAGEQPADPRWRRIAAPLVELGPSFHFNMLEASLDGSDQTYLPGPALLTSRGVLLVDDLGRQAVPPGQIIERLLPAAERGEISVGLPGTRRHVGLPFTPQLILATNLQPGELLSPGQLRRIRHKLYLPDLGPEAFSRLFEREQKRLEIPESPTIADLLHHVSRGRPTPAVQAVEILGRVRDYLNARGRGTAVDKELVESAWRSLYTDH